MIDINWDMVEALFRYGISECKAGQPLPLLLAQGEFNTPQKQEKVSQSFTSLMYVCDAM